MPRERRVQNHKKLFYVSMYLQHPLLKLSHLVYCHFSFAHCHHLINAILYFSDIPYR
jgi:hypothetical protein